MRTDAEARGLRNELNKILKLAAKDRSSQPEAAAMAKKLKLDVDGSGIKFSLKMVSGDLDTNLRSFRARHSAPPPAVVADVKPAPVAKPQVIRIEGLGGRLTRSEIRIDGQILAITGHSWPFLDIHHEDGGVP